MGNTDIWLGLGPSETLHRLIFYCKFKHSASARDLYVTENVAGKKNDTHKMSDGAIIQSNVYKL